MNVIRLSTSSLWDLSFLALHSPALCELSWLAPMCMLGCAAARWGVGVWAILLPAGGWDLPCVHRAARTLRFGRRVSQHGHSQTPQTATVCPGLLLHAGIHHPRLLHWRHTRPYPGEWPWRRLLLNFRNFLWDKLCSTFSLSEACSYVHVVTGNRSSLRAIGLDWLLG